MTRCRERRRGRPLPGWVLGRPRGGRRAARATCRAQQPAPRGESPRPLLRSRPFDDAIAVLIDTQSLVLVQELAAKQTAGILRHSAQPLLGGLLGRPLLDVLRASRVSRRLGLRLLAGVGILFGVFLALLLAVV